MSVWNRRVTATADGQHLQVDEVTNNPNPPGHTDPADSITVHATDRPAMINYLGDGVAVTGIRMKDGSSLPSGLSYQQNGNNLQVTDSGATGTNFSYYVVGTYGTQPVETEDPQIHNIE